MDIQMELNKIYNEDCIEGMKRIESGSVDCILTDPPYLYLKNQKLDREFNETAFFDECNRILKKDGIIVLFGRGTSFYRWNTILADLGFKFKEEIVWNKSYCTSPLMPLSRVHETISIHAKGKGKINKVKVPYLEMREHDLTGLVTDLKRLKTVFRNTKSFDAVLRYLELNEFNFKDPTFKHRITTTGDYGDADRATGVARSIQEGMNEKSVITQNNDHYTAIHPTQKPVRLLERLMALVSKQGDTILDPFSGSGATMIAAWNTGRNAIGFEIDKEYFDKGNERIASVERRLFA